MNWFEIQGLIGTHRRLLFKALEATEGPVLEIGVGYESTPYLHEYCAEHDRFLLSCETNAEWLEKFRYLESGRHELLKVKADYTDAPVEACFFWDVAFIDHGPDAQRHIEAMRAAQHAKIVVIHDTEPMHPAYLLERVWPLYKYRIDDKNNGCPEGWTSALSNFVDLSAL